MGTAYFLVELETPHIQPYTKKYTPSARLTSAIQQIQNWQTWLNERQLILDKLFPSMKPAMELKANFNYIIVIGRREDDRRKNESRNNLAYKLGIKIVSYDHFTEYLETLVISDKMSVNSSEFECVSDQNINQLSNPFFKATNFSDWKYIAHKLKLSHPYGNGWRAILSKRKYSKRLEEFDANYVKGILLRMQQLDPNQHPERFSFLMKEYCKEVEPDLYEILFSKSFSFK
jgi:hypothetical protein